MKKDELKNLGLTDEQADAVIAGYKDFIPKSRFDEVNEARKNAESLVAERDKQIEGLKVSAGSTDELKKQIEKMQAENKALVEAKDNEIKKIKINNAVNTALMGAGAKNVKAALALLNMENTELMEDGSVKGLNEQIEALKTDEDSKFLFADPKPVIKGANPVGGSNNPKTVTKEQFARMGYKERVELYNTNKALYDELSAED
jgi:hypothetical protein